MSDDDEPVGPAPLGITADVVVAGELIEAAWGNQVRGDLVELFGLTERTVESRLVTLSMASVAISTTATTVANAAPVGNRPYPQLLIATASLYVTKDSGTATAFDFYLTCTGATVGPSRRVRLPPAQSMHQTHTFLAPASTSITVTAQIGCASGSAVVSSAGGADFNYVQVIAVPIYAYTNLL